MTFLAGAYLLRKASADGNLKYQTMEKVGRGLIGLDVFLAISTIIGGALLAFKFQGIPSSGAPSPVAFGGLAMMGVGGLGLIAYPYAAKKVTNYIDYD